MGVRNYYAISPLSKSEYYVQGQRATLNEANVAWALEQLEQTYIFQFSILGGKILRGGMVIDFMILTPFPIPLEVNGEYWHRNMELELRQKAEVDAYLSRYGYASLEILWGNQTDTPELALANVRRILYG